MNTTEQKMDIARTIAQQIGGRAFFMMGTRLKLALDSGLQFDVRGSSKHIHKIRVILTPLDTYTVEFWRGACGRALPCLLATAEDVYADNLNAVIESNTGLVLSL